MANRGNKKINPLSKRGVLKSSGLASLSNSSSKAAFGFS